jgi:DNA-binding NarL/FixJ family response regulator
MLGWRRATADDPDRRQEQMRRDERAPKARRAESASAGWDPPPGRSAADISSLTRRELEVLKLLARGHTNGELAALLHIGEGTVKTHVARILGKLGLRDRVQAVVLSYESGVVRPRSEVGGCGAGKNLP